MNGKNHHILTMPRSGSKVFQKLLTLGLEFKYGKVCQLEPGHAGSSLAEFLMFEHLRHWAFSKNAKPILSGRTWNLFNETPDEPVAQYDIERISPGKYQLVEAGYSYIEGVPEAAFRQRVQELATSPIPWVSKSFPASMVSAMYLDQEFILHQLASLQKVSSTIALIRRNVVDTCISFYFMKKLSAYSPARVHDKISKLPSNQPAFKIGESHLQKCELNIKIFMDVLQQLGCDKLVFMEDVIAHPADTIIDILDLKNHPDTLGLRLALEQIPDHGRETTAYFDYPTVVGNYPEIVERMRPMQNLIDSLAGTKNITSSRTGFSVSEVQ